MRKLYLHIGSMKTGTTTLQKFLSVNRQTLINKGLRYPGKGLEHHSLITYFQEDAAKLPRLYRHFSAEKIAAIRDRAIKALTEELENSSEHIIISSEYLGHADQALIAKIQSFFSTYFDEIIAIYFVRDPVGLYQSLTQQGLKASSNIRPPAQFKYRFRETIEAWASLFPIKVLGHDRRHDVVESFCNTLPLNVQDFTRIDRQNETMPIEKMKLLEKLQAQLYPDQQNRLKPHFRSLIHKVYETGHPPRLKPEAAKIIYQNHQSNYLWLKNEYGIEFARACEAQDLKPEWLEKFSGNLTLEDVFQSDTKAQELFELEVINTILKSNRKLRLKNQRLEKMKLRTFLKNKIMAYLSP